MARAWSTCALAASMDSRAIFRCLLGGIEFFLRGRQLAVGHACGGEIGIILLLGDLTLFHQRLHAGQVRLGTIVVGLLRRHVGARDKPTPPWNPSRR